MSFFFFSLFLMVYLFLFLRFHVFLMAYMLSFQLAWECTVPGVFHD